MLALFSCKRIEALAPKNTVLPYPTINKEISAVTIPIEVDLTSYLKDADDALPKSFSGKEEQCEGVSVKYYFNREPIIFYGSGNKIIYSVNGALRLNLNYCVKCQYLTDGDGACLTPRVYVSCGDGEPLRRFNLQYSTTVKVNPNYSLNSTTALQKFEMLDPCRMSFVNFDVTDKVEAEISKQLKILEKEIDSQIQSVDIKSTVKETWNLLQEPNLIPGYGYLNLSPSSVSMSEIILNKNKAHFDFNLTLSPSFTTEKLAVKKAPLPDLTISKNNSGLSFGLDVVLSYDSLSSFIRRVFKGTSYDVKGRKITIEDISVSGSQDNRLILKTTFSGSKKGTVFLLASPILNNSLKRIELSNVDFDVQSKSVLLKSAKWFFNSKIIKKIEENANYDYTPMVNDMKKQINTSLNQELSKGVSMSGSIKDIKLNNIFYGQNHLVLRTHLEGNLKLIIK